MSLWDKVTGLFRAKQFEPPAQTIGEVLDLVRRREPPNRGDRALLVAYHSIPSLHIATRRKAEAVASVDIQVQRDGEPVDHPLADLLANPNAYMTGRTRRMLQQEYFDVLGEALDVVLPDDSRDDELGFSLYPVPKTWCQREVTTEGVYWEVTTPDGARWKVPDEYMLWRKSPDLENPYGRGKGFGRVLADEIEIIEYSAAFEKAEFYNDARPSMAINLPGAQDDQLRQFKEAWLQRFRGPDKNNTPAFFNDGNMSIQEISRSLADSKVLEVRDHEDQIVQRTLGIPPIYVGRVENANRANAFIQRQLFGELVDAAVRDELEHIEQNMLPLFADQDIELHAESAVPEDAEQKLAAAEAFPHTLTVNEWREMQGFPPREDGDVYLRPNPAQLVEADAGSTEAMNQQTRQIEDDSDTRDVSDVVIRFSDYRTKNVPAEAQTIAGAIPLENVDSTEAREFYEEQLQEWAEKEAAALGISVDMALLNPAFVEFAQEQGAKLIKGVDETTKGQVRDIVAQGIREGKNPLETARDLRKKFDDWGTTRTNAIARTESVKTVEFGKLQTYKQSGLVPKREWVATFDSNTRLAHAQLHGQRVGVDDSFVNPQTGSKAKYPGDFPEAAQSINCRCGTVPWIDEMSPALKPFPQDVIDEIGEQSRAICVERAKHSGRTVEEEAQRFAWWKQFDEDLEQTESKLERIMADRFQRQLEDVLAAMGRVFDIDVEASA